MLRTHGVTHVALLFGLVAGCARPEPRIEPSAAATAQLAGVDWAAAKPLDVTLSEYEFAPAELHLRRGQPYRLTLANRGGSSHTFTAPTLFAASALREDPVGDEALSSGGTITVEAGATREIDLVPLQAGSYPVECSRPLHATFGMTGQAVVE